MFSKHKYGYDISRQVIHAAKFLHKDVIFRQGSFVNIKEKKIDCLIMVNFIHDMNPTDLKNELDLLMKRSNIKLIVLDRITNIDGTNYKYEQHGENIFSFHKYCLKCRSKEYRAAEGAYRFVEFWEKVDDKT